VEGLTFLPYLAGERTPHADPAARGAFAGLSLRHDRGALTRAVLEGVAFGLRDSLDLLRELGVEASVARASGGGAASDLFLRVVASALELPVERVAVDEGAAYGAALLAGVGEGAFASVPEAASLARTTGTIEPAWDLTEALARFRALYPALPRP
jgi:xylulokinase